MGSSPWTVAGRNRLGPQTRRRVDIAQALIDILAPTLPTLHIRMLYTVPVLARHRRHRVNALGLELRMITISFDTCCSWSVCPSVALRDMSIGTSLLSTRPTVLQSHPSQRTCYMTSRFDPLDLQALLEAVIGLANPVRLDVVDDDRKQSPEIGLAHAPECRLEILWPGVEEENELRLRTTC